MKLSKALKHKKKLIKQIDEMYLRFSKYNSTEKNVEASYDPEEAYLKWCALVQELVELKTKIHIANVPIMGKIFAMAEYKTQIHKLKSISTKQGMVRSYDSSIEYVAFMNEVDKDSVIKAFENRIETLQEEIEEFNAITKI